MQVKGFAKLTKFKKSGGVWVCPGLTRKQRKGKSSQNSPILVLIMWGSITCVFCLCNTGTLLKVISIIMGVRGLDELYIQCFCVHLSLCKAPNIRENVIVNIF